MGPTNMGVSYIALRHDSWTLWQWRKTTTS